MHSERIGRGYTHDTIRFRQKTGRRRTRVAAPARRDVKVGMGACARPANRRAQAYSTRCSTIGPLISRAPSRVNTIASLFTVMITRPPSISS